VSVSQALVSAFKSWNLVKTPTLLFHGCRSGDYGVDVAQSRLAGNKWFSADAYYAGEYAWHMSAAGAPLRAAVSLNAPLNAVECPAEIRGTKFPEFLAACFPSQPLGYGLSRHFQDTLAEHLNQAFGGGVVAYVSHREMEVLIPNCESWLASCSFTALPATKAEYVEQSGLLPLLDN